MIQAWDADGHVEESEITFSDQYFEPALRERRPRVIDLDGDGAFRWQIEGRKAPFKLGGSPTSMGGRPSLEQERLGEWRGSMDSAELRGVGRLGDVAFDGAYRQIKIDEAASVRLTAVDGDVEVGRLNGPAEISTARGDIRITEALRGTVVLRTQSGDITVGAAAGVSAALDAGTGHGRISNALKNDGTAGLDIRATTSHGDITARSL